MNVHKHIENLAHDFPCPSLKWTYTHKHIHTQTHTQVRTNTHTALLCHVGHHDGHVPGP